MAHGFLPMLLDGVGLVVAIDLTWRFMGSYRWGHKSPNWVLTIVILLVALLLTTHEPPSRACA